MTVRCYNSRPPKPINRRSSASVVELVDTSDSKSDSFAGVTVQVRPLVPLVFPNKIFPKPTINRGTHKPL